MKMCKKKYNNVFENMYNDVDDHFQKPNNMGRKELTSG